MSQQNFKVDQVDHIHVYVSDRYRAAEWYRQILGLEIHKPFEFWAEDPNGPLTITSDGGNTEIALFQRDPKVEKRFSTVAFRTNGEGFLIFLELLATNEVFDQNGVKVTANDVEDHEKSYSIYFNDPDGNPIELTTYDYDYVRERLKS